MSYRISDNGTDRDMTADEIAAHETRRTEAQAESEARAEQQSAKAAARASALAKLSALGLTDDEVSALLG